MAPKALSGNTMMIMRSHAHSPLVQSFMVLLLASCGSMTPVTQVRDDVYYLPSQAPLLASTEPVTSVPTQGSSATDDYFDPNDPDISGAEKGFYDVTYNDPHYYNYARFGFGASVSGWQSGWNGAGWGMGLGMGWGCCAGPGLGWNDPFYFGGVGLYNTWGGPWGMDPWGYGPYGYGGFGYAGFGYGGYYGPWGNCYSCYAPVIVGDGWTNTVVAPRPSMGSGGGDRSSGTVKRLPVRNSVGLVPMSNGLTYEQRQQRSRTSDRMGRPTEDLLLDRSRSGRGTNDRSSPSRTLDRSVPDRSLFDGGRMNPSPSRDTGGGGTRTSPSRR